MRCALPISSRAPSPWSARTHPMPAISLWMTRAPSLISIQKRITGDGLPVLRVTPSPRTVRVERLSSPALHIGRIVQVVVDAATHFRLCVALGHEPGTEDG